MIRHFIRVLLVLMPSSAVGQVTVSDPGINIVRTVEAGGALYIQRQVYVVEVARLIGPTQLDQTRRVGPSDTLVSMPTRGNFKVCVYLAEAPCLLDDDGDGTFDRWAGSMIAGARALNSPIPYSRSELEVDATDGFGSRVIFLGSTPDTLRLSYREFSGGYARPAFTEDLTFPLTSEYPQIVAFRGARMRVHRITGEGITYELLSVPQPPSQLSAPASDKPTDVGE